MELYLFSTHPRERNPNRQSHGVFYRRLLNPSVIRQGLKPLVFPTPFRHD
jgi:hypothetical protein